MKYAQKCKSKICKARQSAMKEHFGCPVQATSNVLAGKWKVLIVWHLSFGSYRFAELRTLLPGVTEKVLTAQLRDLQRDGIISRKADTDRLALRTDYFLSGRRQSTHPGHGSNVRVGSDLLRCSSHFSQAAGSETKRRGWSGSAITVQNWKRRPMSMRRWLLAVCSAPKPPEMPVDCSK